MRARPCVQACRTLACAAASRSTRICHAHARCAGAGRRGKPIGRSGADGCRRRSRRSSARLPKPRWSPQRALSSWPRRQTPLAVLPTTARARAGALHEGRPFVSRDLPPVQKARRGGEDGENLPKRPSNPAGLYMQECYKDARVLPQYPASAPTAPPSARLAPASSIAWTLRCGPFLTRDESSCAVCPVACRLPRHRSVLC